MRRCVASLLGAALTCVPATLQAQTAELTAGVNNLFSIAEGHNATLRSLQSAVAEAEAGIESARMAKLPEIEGQASVSYLGNARLWNRHFGESTSAHMPHYGNNFSLKAQQVIYAGGSIMSSIELAKQAAQMQSLSAEEGRKQVRFLLVGLYLQLHSLHNSRQVYATNAALAESQIALMRKRREQGVSLRNDVTRYELQLQEMQLGESTTADRESIVRRQLITALGTDSAQIALLGEAAFDESAISQNLEQVWQQIATDSHTGLQKSQLNVDINRTKERLERSAMLPKLAVIAEDHLDGPITIEVPPINKNLNYWYVGLGVSYNFSSLYKAKRRVRQAELSTALAADQHAVALEGVSDAVHAAYVNLGTARTELATRLKSVQLASENYDVVARRYENGLAIVTDLTDAANMKLDAELALVNARINLAYSLYNLKYAAGDL